MYVCILKGKTSYNISGVAKFTLENHRYSRKLVKIFLSNFSDTSIRKFIENI